MISVESTPYIHRCIVSLLSCYKHCTFIKAMQYTLRNHNFKAAYSMPATEYFKMLFLYAKQAPFFKIELQLILFTTAIHFISIQLMILLSSFDCMI